MKKPKETPEIKEIQEEAFVVVNQTVIGKSKEDVKQIKVTPFITNPAYVEVHAKRHIPLGANMGGVTVSVTINSPCYNEELGSHYKRIDEIVDKIIEKKVNTILAELKDVEK
jgi:hypothetical protein